MEQQEEQRFQKLYQRHLLLLKLQEKSNKTIDAYSRAVRRVSKHFDCCPDTLTHEQLQDYFSDLVESHSWSTVKLDRLGLMFYWRYVLKRNWHWVNMIKPPKTQTIPDILSPAEIELLIGKTRQLRYRVFLLTTYSMGLRLAEALSLQVGDIDGEAQQVHIRHGMGSCNSLQLSRITTMHMSRNMPIPPCPVI